MLGFIVYSLLLFFPGAFVGLLLDFFQGRRFIEVVAYSFGLSLIALPPVLLLAYVFVRGIPPDLVYGLLVASVAATVILARIKRVKFAMPSIEPIEAAAFFFVLVQGILLLYQYTKYPIFPISQSNDFRYHLLTALQFEHGQISLSTITYPPAVHVIMATLLTTQAGNAITISQYALSIMATFAPLLFYAVTIRMFQNKRLALVTVIMYVFSGALWYTTLFASGLFANFLADLVTIAVILVIMDSLKKFTLARTAFMALCGLVLILAHYTSLEFIAAFWLGLPVVWKMQRESLKVYAEIAALLTAPGGLIALAKPGLIQTIPQILGLTGQNAGIILISPDPISSFFAVASPFLEFLYEELGVSFFIFSMVTVGVVIWLTWKKQVDMWVPLITVWFLLIWVTTPYSEISWRFAKYAVLPLICLWPALLKVGLPSVFWPTKKSAAPKLARLRQLKGNRMANSWVQLAVVLLALGLLFHAPITGMLTDLQIAPGPISENEQQLYDGMAYLAAHSPHTANVIGLEDWRLSFMNPVWGYNITLYRGVNATGAYEIAEVYNATYILVSDFEVPGPLSSIVGVNPNAQGFASYPNFTLLYSNPTIQVYMVNFT